jgi:lipid II:glycine glycyltransferase (peptidoglycan interpeptide bridge formation enzyme)
MIEHLTLDQAGALDEFVAAHPKGHYMQTTRYGRSRPDYQWHGIVLRDENGQIYASMALHARTVRFMGKKMYYAPRGPVFSTPEAFREIIAAAKDYCRKNKGYLLRIDPAMLAEDTAFRSEAEALGFRFDPRDDYSTFIARKVYITDLEGLTEEELLSKFHSKTRYNIRLAQRRGVTVRDGNLDELEIFRQMMLETASRDGFSAKSVAFYRALLEAFGDDAQLLLAEKDGQILAGAIQLHQGKQSWYVYGCSFNSGREHMPNYLMQWEMIRRAMARGCRVYDFRGVEGDPVPENPHYGLHRFKQGFNSRFVEYAGQLDMTLAPFAYRMIGLLQKFYGLLHK